MAALFDLGYPAAESLTKFPRYRGTSLQAFHARFPHEEACLAHLFNARFGSAPACSHCGRSARWYRIRGTKRFQHPCGHARWPLTGTIFERSNIPLQLWFYAMLHFANSAHGVPSSFLMRQLGLGHKAAYRMADRIRTHMAAIDLDQRVGKAGQRVEIRIEYLLGVHTADFPARGTAKAVILGDADSVQSTLIGGRARRHVLRRIIADKCAAGAVPVTSCPYTHSVLSEFGTRTPAAGFVPRFVDPATGTNPIHSFLNYLKRPMHETYRRVAYAKLWKYLKELEFGFNRRMRSHEIFGDLVGHFPDISPGPAAELEAWSSRVRPGQGWPR